MNKKKTLAALLTATLLLVGCDPIEPSGNYYVLINKPMTGNSNISIRYANETADSLVFFCTDTWALASYQSTAPWLKINGATSGFGAQIVKYGVTMEPNTTGQMREAYYRISLTGTTEDAYAMFAYQQLGTRIDGTLGGAPLVKQIEGSDGSTININWDDHSRPTHITMKAGKRDLDMAIAYEPENSDGVIKATFTTNKNIFAFNDTIYTINDLKMTGNFEDTQFNGTKSSILMPRMFCSFESTAKVSMHERASSGYETYANVDHKATYASFSDGLYGISFENALMVNNLLGNFVTSYGIYYGGKYQLYADEKHTADSIAVVRAFPGQKSNYETYKLEYSSIDGRATSVDVNQLIEGVEKCDPFMLLSFFKLARQTSVISKATGRYNTYTVDTKTRSDGAVEKLTVTDKNGNAITYSFSY